MRGYSSLAISVFLAICCLSSGVSAQKKIDSVHYFIDVHHMERGKVTFAAVAAAHVKDLAIEKKYNVHFIRFWVDESSGNVYCLSIAPDSQAVIKTHNEAHGLLPYQLYQVTGGPEAAAKSGKSYFLDVHELGPGKVKARDVAAAYQKDLAVQGKYGVNFINYWVDEKQGRFVCLSQARDSTAVIKTHKEAHGLLPVSIERVRQGP